MRVCRIVGCEQEASGYSTYCDSHKRRDRRHGHPDQTSVTAKELASYRELVRARIKKNESSPVWGMLRDRWAHLINQAEVEMDQFQKGVPCNRYRIDAMSSIRKLGASVEPGEIIEVALAMYLLEDLNQHRFKSHEAFGRQLVRRVRALSDVNVGTYYDHKSGGAKRVYRDAKPKTTLVLAQLLTSTFGSAGVSIAALERKEMEQKQVEQRQFHEALSSLT